MIKKLKRIILALLFIFIIGGFAYTYLRSPHAYRFHNVTMTSQKITEDLNGLRIAFVSDINLSNKDDIDRLKEIVSDLNNQKFDMLIFGGNLFEADIFSSSEISKILKDIYVEYGKFAILGTKDKGNSTELQQLYLNAGVEVLSNTSRQIYYKNSSFTLVASDFNGDISSLVPSRNSFVLSLTHEPDSFIKNQNYVDLQLSGDSLGGTIYIPYIGGLLKDTGYETYVHGQYTVQDSLLLISNGVTGKSNFPYKILTPNEILLITLKAQ